MGDANVPFVVDSASKPFTYALCLDQLGAEVIYWLCFGDVLVMFWWYIGDIDYIPAQTM